MNKRTGAFFLSVLFLSWAAACNEGSESPSDKPGVLPGKADCLEGAPARDNSQSGCTCTYADCGGSEITCDCLNSCVPDQDNPNPADCPIDFSNPEAPVVTDPDLPCEVVHCRASDDPDHGLACILSECECTQCSDSTFQLDYRAEGFGAVVGFWTDTSESMNDNRAAAVCAVDAFFDTVGAQFDSTVVAHYGYALDAQFQYKSFKSGVELVQDCVVPPIDCEMAQSCQGVLQTGCDHKASPSLTLTVDESLLKKLLAQPVEWPYAEFGEGDEGGLMSMVMAVLTQIEQGAWVEEQRHQFVVITDEDADDDGNLCRDLSQAGIPWPSEFALPAWPGQQACGNYLAQVFSNFAQRYGITVHGLVASSDSQIYSAVIAGTGGRRGEIEQCGGYENFFEDLATDTTTASRKMCIPANYKACDMNTLTVSYKGSALVKGSDFTVDEDSCLTLNEAHRAQYGTYDFTVTCP